MHVDCTVRMLNRALTENVSRMSERALNMLETKIKFVTGVKLQFIMW